MNIIEILFSSFQEFSIIWIIISGLAGAFITAFAKFLFEHTIPQWQLKRATRTAIQKYSFPLMRSLSQLEITLNEILVDPKLIKLYVSNDYFHFRILYFFGVLMGWCRILSRESLLDYTEKTEITKSKNSKEFTMHYSIIFINSQHLIIPDNSLLRLA
jgi:hypothetical protein